MVESFNRLRHDAVVGGDHEDREVSRLRTTGTHGGERLVTRGIEEGELALLALVVDLDLVGTDVLGDSAGLAGSDIGRTDRIEQLGLTVVDVTHDGDDRRACLQIFIVFFCGFGIEVDVEGLQQLTVFVFGRNDLDLVAELLTEDLEGRLVEGLRDRGHLTEVEEHGDEVRRIGVDLLGEVGQRGAATQTQRRIAVSARNGDATDRRSLHLLELCALRPLRLASLLTGTATAAECTLCASATAT